MEQLITAQENERANVARELHDDSGQTFTALLVGLRSIRDAATLEAAKERAVKLGAIASAAVASVGRIARGLHPSVLDSFGLSAAIQQTVTDFTNVHGIPVHLNTGGLKPHDLSPAVELALYRVLQESLTNVAKHTAAKEVTVDISISDGLAKLSIRDDGVGFDISKERSATNKLGLRSMTERAALLGGLLRVESSISVGTTITVEVPMYTGTEGCKS
jgi:signal transduction histidine kinase